MRNSYFNLPISALVVFATGCSTTPPLSRPSDLTSLSATESVRLLRAGVISSTELTQAELAKAHANPELNAFIVLDDAGALRQAAAADEALRAGQGGPLTGLPIVIKDNIRVAGLPASAGTPALASQVVAEDAPVVATLRAAGAVILGKTNMHELAFGISGYNEAMHGSTIGVRNAYDHSRMAGGSSSGNGAAIGARIVAAGIGTDTGGSARIPSAFNGITGFRPSVGRYSAEGVVPISHTRDTPGAMGRTVADVALLDGVLTGQAPVKPIDLHGLRLGLDRADFFANLDSDTAAVMQQVLAKLEQQGAVLVPVSMPGLAGINGRIGFPVALYEAYDDMQRYLKRYQPETTVEAMAARIGSADVKGTYAALVIPRLLPGPGNSLVPAQPIYQAALSQARPELQALYATTFAENHLDALLFPTTPHVAPPAGPESSSLANFGLYIQNTDPGSNAGIPGLSIPAGLGASGLPVGVEIDGPSQSDRRLIAVGEAIEAALGPLPAPHP